MRTTLGVLFAAFTCASTVGGQSPARRLTRPIEFWNSDWSPDGKSLVFESTLDGKYSIYVINVDGSGLRRLTVDTANNEQPRWSPDGTRIVFSSDRASGHLDIYVMNADGSGQTRLTSLPGGGYYRSSFSPDGRMIAFQGRHDNREVRDHVFAMMSDGTGLRQVSDTAYGAEDPRWSRDGEAITFTQVPYAKRFWAEMQQADRVAARAGRRMVSVRPDGSGLEVMPQVAGTSAGDSYPVWSRDGGRALFTSARDGSLAVYEMSTTSSEVRRIADAALIPDIKPSPQGRMLAYEKAVDGWAGIYVFDIATKSERLVVGGPGAGPMGYLRTASLTEHVDTLDAYESPRGAGPAARGNGAWVVETVKRGSGQRWELTSTWYDSAGRVTAVQSVRTARGSLKTELEMVRAAGDSASALVTPDRVTAWVVSQGQPARLFDGAGNGDRFASSVIAAAIAKARPLAGQRFLTATSSLYGGNPLEVRVDSVRVLRRETVFQGGTALTVLVLERGAGELWVDEATGSTVLARGNAGREKWWWHIRRGVKAPTKF